MPSAAQRRWIAHLDMDAFYASVELLRYPELVGQPVVIGGGRRHQPRQRDDGTREFATLSTYKGRGVITTATYPARDYGVRSGIPDHGQQARHFTPVDAGGRADAAHLAVWQQVGMRRVGGADERAPHELLDRRIRQTALHRQLGQRLEHTPQGGQQGLLLVHLS